MKRLEELRISPTPWYVDRDNMMLDSNGHYIQLNGNYFTGEHERIVANQNMMVAAPKMYERLRQSTNMIEHSIQFIKNNDIKISLQKLAEDNKAVLVEAAGESEVK